MAVAHAMVEAVVVVDGALAIHWQISRSSISCLNQNLGIAALVRNTRQHLVIQTIALALGPLCVLAQKTANTQTQPPPANIGTNVSASQSSASSSSSSC